MWQQCWLVVGRWEQTYCVSICVLRKPVPCGRLLKNVNMHLHPPLLCGCNEAHLNTINIVIDSFSFVVRSSHNNVQMHLYIFRHIVEKINKNHTVHPIRSSAHVLSGPSVLTLDGLWSLFMFVLFLQRLKIAEGESVDWVKFFSLCVFFSLLFFPLCLKSPGDSPDFEGEIQWA